MTSQERNKFRAWRSKHTQSLKHSLNGIFIFICPKMLCAMMIKKGWTAEKSSKKGENSWKFLSERKSVSSAHKFDGLGKLKEHAPRSEHVHLHQDIGHIRKNHLQATLISRKRDGKPRMIGHTNSSAPCGFKKEFPWVAWPNCWLEQKRCYSQSLQRLQVPLAVRNVIEVPHWYSFFYQKHGLSQTAPPALALIVALHTLRLPTY